MNDKHYLSRVVLVRYIDALFYESGDARWCHSRCHSLLTGPLCGIGENTHWNYLHYDHPQLLAQVQPAPPLKELLRLYVLLVKKLPAAPTAELLHTFYRLTEHALRDTHRREATRDTDALIQRLHQFMQELDSEP